MRRLIVVGLVLAASLVGVDPAGAHEVAPGGGSAFGQHVAGMAPEHARAHGPHFGACVSAMAQNEDCPHTDG
jgi:hypothetical protein